MRNLKFSKSKHWDQSLDQMSLSKILRNETKILSLKYYTTI